MKKSFRLFQKLSAIAVGAAALATLPAAAADITVKMLNNGKDGQMVFEPSYVKAAVGDTLVFQSTEKGAHQSMSLLVPAGAKTWRAGEPALPPQLQAQLQRILVASNTGAAARNACKSVGINQT